MYDTGKSEDLKKNLLVADVDAIDDSFFWKIHSCKLSYEGAFAERLEERNLLFLLEEE